MPRQWTGLGRFELPKLADTNPFSADTIPGFAVWIIPCFTETTHTSHSTIAFKLNSWLICHFGALLLYSLCGSPVFIILTFPQRRTDQVKLLLADTQARSRISDKYKLYIPRCRKRYNLQTPICPPQ